jgi:phenylpropionate dioxygenase-like ring-hydroxylating dioxygenase large terminal subunit
MQTATSFTSPWTAEAHWWHPVCGIEQATSQPVAVVALGHALMVWRDAAGVPHVWLDQCPHRGARLSLGKVVNNQLQCAYHGWAFDASGRCSHVPAVPSFNPPPSHCARQFESREAYGLVWVRFAPHSDGSPAFMPSFPAESDTALRKVMCGPYTVQTSAPRIVENFLDMAHFGFVHEGWLGDAQHTALPAFEVQESAGGVTATGCKAWQPQSNLHSSEGAWVDYGYQVDHPYAAVLTKIPDPQSIALTQYREAIGLFICPLGPDQSLVWFRLAVADFESSEASLRAFQDVIFMQDKPVLESQWPKCLPLAPGAEVHAASDKLSSAYRRFLRQAAVRLGVLATDQL